VPQFPDAERPSIPLKIFRCRTDTYTRGRCRLAEFAGRFMQ